jgi:hypothetical protein
MEREGEGWKLEVRKQERGDRSQETEVRMRAASGCGRGQEEKPR